MPSLAKSNVQKLLLIVTVAISFILQCPQPEADNEYFSSLASAYTSSSSGDPPLEGINIVITGATSGIGFSLAKKLHSLGGNVIALGRSPAKLSKLQDELSNRNNQVSTRVVDLQDLDSVALAADELNSEFGRIDFLINNAGIAYDLLDADRATSQGFDAAFGVNYLSHFLLTEKLLPTLKRSNARIINVSSSFHTQTNGDDLVPSLDGGDPFASRPSSSRLHSLKAYGSSKLAQIFHGRSLTRSIESEANNSLRIISICPSWVATNIAGSLFKKILDVFAFESEFGITPILFSMFHPDAGAKTSNGGHNDYVTNCSFFTGTRMQFFEKIVFSLDWPKGLRAVNVYCSAPILMMAQRFLADVGMVKSSEDSYDISKQDALYEWSILAIAPWMHTEETESMKK